MRCFDARLRRPGPPSGVAALVDSLAHDRVGIQLHNLSEIDPAELIVQAGAFGEHSFTTLASGDGAAQVLPGEPKWFAVVSSQALLPHSSTTIPRLIEPF